MPCNPWIARVFAVIVAAIWIAATLVVFRIFSGEARWVAVICWVPFSLWRGVVWIRVVRTGRYPTLRASLFPWRKGCGESRRRALT
jgi:hypothetical protein